MFEVLPVLLIGPFADLAADRMPRRRLRVGADLIRACAVASLIFAPESVTAVFAAAFVLSAAATVFNPAATSLLPDVVDDADLITGRTAPCGASRSSPKSRWPLPPG